MLARAIKEAMIPLVDIYAQYETIKDGIDAAISEVISSGSFIRGPALGKFEQAFANLHNCKEAIGVGSGSEALHMAALACGLKENDEVITVANTWISTAFAASYVGATPVLVDIDPNTYQMDAAQVEQAINQRTRAIFPVHMFGHPAPMDEIMAIAHAHDLLVVEDVAQAPLAEISGQIVGAIGDMGCFSFYPSKNLGCYGDGGAVLTNDPDLAQKTRVFANYGQSEAFMHQKIGWNARLDTMQAAILNTKLPYLKAWTERRRAIAARYLSLLDPERIKLPKEATNAKAVYHLFVVQVPNRDQTLARLRDMGIMAQVHYPTTIHTQPCYAALGYKHGDFPVSEQLSANGLSLPVYPEMTDEQIEEVASCLNQIIDTKN